MEQLVIGNVYLIYYLLIFSCGLKLSTATAISAAVATAAKQGILIKGGNYIEALADIDTVVMDKTGTITVGEPKIVETHTG